MLVGLVLPAVIALVTRESLPDHVKVLMLVFLSTVSGVVSSLLGAVPTTFNAWEHVLLNILMTFLSGAAADIAAWRPSGATKRISGATERFGLGPS
jgi:hypothetical protein